MLSLMRFARMKDDPIVQELYVHIREKYINF